jgi:hypothetical protein
VGRNKIPRMCWKNNVLEKKEVGFIPWNMAEGMSIGGSMSGKEDAKKKLIEMVRKISDQVFCEIPEGFTDGFIQIALSTKGRKLPLLLSEEDFLDILEDPKKMKRIRGQVEELIRDLKS